MSNESDQNWDNPEVERDYLKADRNGWRSLCVKAETSLLRWRLASFLMFPFAIDGAFRVGKLVFDHLRVLWL